MTAHLAPRPTRPTRTSCRALLVAGMVLAASACGSDAEPAAPQTAAPTSTTGSFTMAQVAEHADESSCWAAIDGTVYDLTGWIAQHPGGPDRIRALCGTDASEAFGAQHGQSAGVRGRLVSYRIGTLAG